MTFTARDKQKAAAREVTQRRRVYQRLVDGNRMKRADADREIAVMEAISADYSVLAEAEEAKDRLL